uniref:MSP domain-containing protein n=1 Tax=Caenorhabditis tropicalis TaxID=1561998 RepID=A0A1I7UPJ3_9PELO
MVIPSSGHLDVKIKNPTHKPVAMECTFNSFAFDVERAWYIENGKEVEKNFEWSENPDPDYIAKFEELRAKKLLSHELKPGEVFYIRIKNEDNFDGPKIRLLYEKPIEEMTITTHVNVPLVLPNGKTPVQAKFDLKVNYFFSLTGDSEKMKEVNQKHAEYQKKRERLKRLRGIKIESDETPKYMFCDCGEHYEDEAARFVSKRETRNERLLQKYGTKVDQLTEEEIKKIKEEIRKELQSEAERKHEEEERKKQEKEQKLKEEYERKEKMNKKKKKKFVFF